MPDRPSDLARLVRRRIAEAGDASRAPRMQTYMKSAMPYRGVTAVPLRAICRTAYAELPLSDRAEWEACVRLLWDEAAYREERYAALALTSHRAYRQHQDPDTLPLYRHLVVTGAWWDLVDSLASHGVGAVLADYPDQVTPVVRDWAVDEDLWLRRTAILCQLARKERTDEKLLRFVLEANLEGTLHGAEFFVRKAIGWALREHAKTDPAWVRGSVSEHHERLSGLSRREALMHL
jgi:3-methyladenine DNA glycosylase AlkD